jgi:glycine oxidase
MGVMHPGPVTIIGAGITGLWQALVLAKAGHRVQLLERSAAAAPFEGGASRYAGAMLAPDCEAESAPPLVRDLGRAAIAAWRAVYPRLTMRGSLVVAQPRDRAETLGRVLDQVALCSLEPELADRFGSALYFPDEGHMSAPDALAFLTCAVKAAGVDVRYGVDGRTAETTGILIDCRGWHGGDRLPQLRGVRGERIVVRAVGVELTRAIRLLHPRLPLYVVPWHDHVYMIGATVIESDDDGQMTVRSALELLGAAYSLHPGFGEAAVLDMGAGVRPALPDNVPRVYVQDAGRTICVNGAYRHGFLLAPMLAAAVCDYLAERKDHPLLVRQS